jgi:hypothetical protein
MISGPNETVVRQMPEGCEAAWFPGLLEHITTHPGGRAWAGTVRSASHVSIIALEGVCGIGPCPSCPAAGWQRRLPIGNSDEGR